MKRRRLSDVNPEWWNRLFFIGLILTIAMFTCTSCETNQKQIHYRYRIEGQVPWKGTTHAAVWLTDTFVNRNDTLIITNSDSSQWRIAPPYTITEIR
jgi:hypothetical protein